MTDDLSNIVAQRIKAAPERERMEALGYFADMTGGGCLAWTKNVKDDAFYIRVTFGGPDIGEKATDLETPDWIVGVYRSEEEFGEATEFLAGQTFEQVVENAEALEHMILAGAI